MKQIYLTILIFLINGCNDAPMVHKKTVIEKQDYLEKYYELEEVRYENYLKTLAG